MDKKKVVFQILDSYAEITITDQQDNIVFFEIGGKEYGCWYPEIDQDTGSPFIFVKNDTEYDYPHIVQQVFRWIKILRTNIDMYAWMRMTVQFLFCKVLKRR